jgi:hypothetical protein
VAHAALTRDEGDAMPSENDNLSADKKPYDKPKLTRFPLRPEEAVLGFCKSTSAAGPAGGTCRVVVACRSTGS